MSKKKIVLPDKYHCTGCQACVDSCRFDALHSIIGADGHIYVKINRDKCTQCGMCMRTCPLASHFEYQDRKIPATPFAAWNKDDNQRLKSSSGGVFSAIASYVLQKGGKVVGAILEDSFTHHIVIDRIEDLPQLQGSKYQQSDAKGIYAQTRELLRNGTLVLFSGTPCQVAGLLSYLGRKQYDNLITVDLICGGVPSWLNVEKFLELSPDTEIASYRNKDKGWISSYKLTVTKNGQKVVTPPYSDIVTKAYSGGLTNRYSCYDCKFCGINKKSDMTIGDYWGDTHFKKEHFLGVSFIVVHSKSGFELINNANLAANPIDWKEPLSHNPRLINGHVIFGRQRLERSWIAFNFKHLPYKWLRIIYCGDMKSLLLLPYKTIRYALWRINIIYQKQTVNKILRSL